MLPMTVMSQKILGPCEPAFARTPQGTDLGHPDLCIPWAIHGTTRVMIPQPASAPKMLFSSPDKMDRGVNPKTQLEETDSERQRNLRPDGWIREERRKPGFQDVSTAKPCEGQQV